MGETKGSPEAVAALMANVSDKTRSELSGPARVLLDRFKPSGLQFPMDITLGAGAVFLKEPLAILDEEGKREVSRLPKGTKILPAGPTGPTKEDAISLIDAIKSSVIGPKVREMKYLFAMHSLYYVVLISAGVVVNLSPTAATAIGTLGLGSLGVGANYNNLQNAVDKYVNDRRALLDSLQQLDSLEGYERKDFPEGVQKAYDAAQAILTNLTQQKQSNQSSGTA
jgi:hypothetical protein